MTQARRIVRRSITKEAECATTETAGNGKKITRRILTRPAKAETPAPEPVEHEVELVDEVPEVVEHEVDIEDDDAVIETPEAEETVAEEVEQAPEPAVKPVKKAAKKKAAKATEEELSKEAAPKEGRSLFGHPKKKEVELKPLELGATMPREEILRRFGELHDVNVSEFAGLFRKFEHFMVSEIFPNYSANLFGAHFKRAVTKPALRSGVGGLDIEPSGLSTLTNSHVTVRTIIRIGAHSERGIVDEETGEFISGNFDEDGNFVKGTWTNTPRGKVRDFVPAEKAGKKKRK